MSEADQLRGDLELLQRLIERLRRRAHPGDGVILTAAIGVFEQRRDHLDNLSRQPV